MNFFKTILFSGFIFSLTACSVTKHLDKKQRVHVSTEISFLQPKLINKKKKLEAELLLLAQPKPATGIKKWQTKMYNALQKSKRKKGLKYKIRKKYGRPPVFFDAKKVERSRLVLENHMRENGYFGVEIKTEISEKKQKVSVKYVVMSQGQYRIRKIDYPIEPRGLAHTIKSDSSHSLLQPGNPYIRLKLTTERNRLASLANNSGYLNINQGQFYFFADTTIGNRQVDIFLKIRQSTDSTTFQKYRLNSDVVFGKYSLTFQPQKGDTTLIENFIIIQKNDIVRPKVLADIIGGDKNEYYSKKKQDDALARLLDLGIYKFVNLKFEKIYKDSIFLFNRQFYLTPSLLQDVATEFQVNTRSGNFFGIGSSVSYTHKNIFRGAEQLNLSLAGGVETQIGETENFINTADIGIKTSLAIPDFLLPFKVKKGGGKFVPRTLISINDNFQQRIGYYTSNNFNSKFGYEWNELADRRHGLYPINISQISVFKTSEDFDNLLLANPRLRKSFENAFILGLSYNFTYNTLTTSSLQRYSYFRMGLKTSGNVASLASQLINQNGSRPYKFLGTPFSQFVRFDMDYRYFIPRPKGLFASRFIGGVGVPYNTSTVLPFVEQFSAGGSNDIRAFALRSLGPGSYPPNATITNDFLDQTGDIKLELNLEYRFPIFSFFKGAIFVDAGNIWLIKDVENARPEGVFKFNRFYKEIAIGTGVGFRLDFEYVVIRVDAAFPIRKPFIVNNENWTFSQIDFLNKSWRKDNLVWNFAIGYPF
ncbi:MAG: BamA/TamA family outer membrane protein [Saprospiraceae bacterium]